MKSVRELAENFVVVLYRKFVNGERLCANAGGGATIALRQISHKKQ